MQEIKFVKKDQIEFNKRYYISTSNIFDEKHAGFGIIVGKIVKDNISYFTIKKEINNYEEDIYEGNLRYVAEADSVFPLNGVEEIKPLCPHCGNIHEFSYGASATITSLRRYNEIWECEKCHKKFEVRVNIAVTIVTDVAPADAEVTG